MHVAVQLEFKADRKEPLGVLVRRVAALFESAGLQPQIEASFSDGPVRPSSAARQPSTARSRSIRTSHPSSVTMPRVFAPTFRRFVV
jgi:hypothetical protein